MRGIPFKITFEEIIDFLKGHGTITKDEIFIEESNGRRTGTCLIFFDTDQFAQDAKSSLNGQKIGA